MQATDSLIADIPRFSLRHSITRKLLTVIFSIYFLVTVIITLSHMYVEYQHTEGGIISELVTFERILKPVLAEALWNFDEKQVQSTLEGATNSSIIVGAQVKTTVGLERIWTAGYYLGVDDTIHFYDIKTQKDNFIPASRWFKMHPHTFDLNYEEHDGGLLKIGTATLYSSSDVIFQQVFFGFFLLIFNAFVKTIALWTFFFWAGYVYLTRPLWALTQAIERIRNGELNGVQVQVNPKGTNEIDVLGQGFNAMVTELLGTRERLDEIQRRLENVINAMPSILITVTEQGIITDWNSHAEQKTKISAREAINKPLMEVYPPFVQYVRKMQTALIERKIQKITNSMELIEDEQRYYDIVIYPITTDVFRGAVIRIDDVTHRVQMESVMIQSEKMSSIGSLAAGMAHEINNPLGAVLQGAQNVMRRIDPKVPANIEAAKACGIELEKLTEYFEARKIPKFIQGIRDAGERAAQIVANLLQFSRRTNSTRAPSSLYNVVAKSLELARTDYSLKKQTDFKHIQVIVECAENIPLVFICVMEIEQVVLNLLKNAAQAMVDLSRMPQVILRMFQDGDMVQLEIEDNGPGMPEKVRRRVFEPFFTTKAPGVGTGLGLSVSYGIIVEAHKGEMRVESKEGMGTKFIIRLPIKGEEG